MGDDQIIADSYLDNRIIKVNLNWIVQKRNTCYEIFSVYGEKRIISEKGDSLTYKIFQLCKEKKRTLQEIVQILGNLGTNIKKGEIANRINDLLFSHVLTLEPSDLLTFSKEELERYRWQLEYFSSFESLSVSRYDIQQNLKNSKVIVIGLGGQGSIISQILTSMGVGLITGVDGDTIEKSNLTRQILYIDNDIGKFKSDVLKNRLELQNPNLVFKSIRKYIESEKDMDTVVKKHDFIILCADKPLIKLKRWLNNVALANKIPYLAVSSNWVGPICIPFQTPCFECISSYERAEDKNYDKHIAYLEELGEIPRPSFAIRPILSGTLISLEVIKYLSKVMHVDVLNGMFRLSVDLKPEFKIIERNKKCIACGDENI